MSLLNVKIQFSLKKIQLPKPNEFLRKYLSEMCGNNKLSLSLLQLQKFQCYCSARFCVAKRMMVVFHIIATGSRRQMELMTGYIETSAGSCKCAIKLIIGIFHAILLKNSFQTALVKRTVMSHKRQILDFAGYLCPYFRKCRLTVGITPSKTMHFSCPICVVVGSRPDKAVKPIYDLSVPYYNNAYATHTGAATVGGFKIYRRKIAV